MTNTMTAQLAETVRKLHLPRYRQIPDVGLYLEQVTKYINQAITPLGCAELTGSMVSNYVKKGIIDRPIKKLYDANRIAHLTVIALLKSILTMEEIARLFRMQKESYPDEVAYDYFCDELENMLHFVFGVQETVQNIGVTESMEKTMLRSGIIALSHSIYLHRCFCLTQEDISCKN